MNKMLMLASVASMIDQFNMPNIKLLLSLGYSVDVACNFTAGSTCSDERIEELKKRLREIGVRCYQIDFARHITDMAMNIKAFWQVEELMKKNEYVFVHCHSPIGGVVGRIAGWLSGVKVIYTAHGFHFYKGAPMRNWLIYYPVEKICSYMTDILITINKEDYALAKKKMRAKRIEYIPGVGIDTDKFGGYRENHIREALGIPDDAKLLLSVGELNRNKNHEIVIRAFAEISAIKGDVYYVIAGQGDLMDHLQDVIDSTGLRGKVMLLGFRSDIADLYDAADIFVFPSRREGLSVALMEAMASGLPVVCSRIRGNVDLLAPEGGLFFEPLDVNDVKEKVEELLLHSKNELKSIGYNNLSKIRLFDMESVEKAIKVTYGSFSETGGGGI